MYNRNINKKSQQENGHIIFAPDLLHTYENDY